MKLFIILASTFLLTFSAQAQILSPFEGMSTEEVRSYLINQESSDLAREMALKHQRTRKARNGFLVVSGMIAGVGTIVSASTSNSDSPTVWAGLEKTLTILAFSAATSLTLVTSLILHTVSRNQLYKAKNTYLQNTSINYTKSPMIGFSFSF